MKMNTINKYISIIGLETHVELKTKSKMFCGCDANWFGKKPNTHTCPVCLGLPGALPVPNKQAVDWTILIGLALNCSINTDSKFDRKHYFYPDLPKGYQISQYDEPIAVNGVVKFKVTSYELRVGKQKHEEYEKTVRIRRVHLEEDTGKLLHDTIDGKKVSLVDFNRSGVPLVEIVTEPDIHSSDEAVAFMKHLHTIIRSLGVSDADMEKGSMRLEPNISVLGNQLSVISNREKGTDSRKPITEDRLPKYKVEVKNINSFRFAKRSIDFEVARHTKLLNEGKTPKQETRGWSESKKATVSQRSKEEAADYRYFPEPDIPPMKFTADYINSIRDMMPKMAGDIEGELVREYQIRPEYARLVVSDDRLLKYLKSLKELKAKMPLDMMVGTIINKKIDIEKVTPEDLIKQVQSKQSSTISDDSQLQIWVDQAMKDLPQAVVDFKSGKQQAIGVLIGKVMQLSKGKADAKKVSGILQSRIGGD